MNEDNEKINEKEKVKERGLLICFEGIEGSGKSTQIKKVEQFFKEKNQGFHTLSFPCTILIKIGEKTVEKIETQTKCLKSFKERATHLLVSFNRWEKREEILSKVESGENVIIENYAFDGIANLIANGEKLDNCLYCDKGLPRPDIVFQLDAEIEIIQKRKETSRSIEFLIKKAKFHEDSF